MSINADQPSAIPTSYQQSPYDAHVSPRPPPSQVGPGASSAQYPADAAAQSQQQQVPIVPAFPQPPPVQLLPLGAVPHNGGILYHSNVFANSYRVPGPNGNGYVYYDNSVPMPPTLVMPTKDEQWHSLTKLLKLFVILVLVFWVLQLIYHWKVGLCMPILFLWTYLGYRQWQKHYQTVELGLLVKLYALGFAPGALIVMLVETVITILFAFICFQDYISEMIQKLQGQGGTDPNPTDPNKGGGGNQQVPEGMEFLNYAESPQLFIFLFLLAFVSAGCCEEGLKYVLTRRVAKYRPSYKDLQGYLLYALAAALGFSTVENIGYVLGGANGVGGDSSLLGIFLNTLGRVFLSTPLHLATAYLIGLQVVRRDVLGEPLSLFQVMSWSIFFHGCFDFGLFLVMVLSKHWSSSPDDNTVSYILMACVLIQCYAGLAYRIWKTRRIVFPHGIEVQHAVDVEAPPSSDPQGAIHAGASNNGFAPLHSDPDAIAVV